MQKCVSHCLIPFCFLPIFLAHSHPSQCVILFVCFSTWVWIQGPTHARLSIYGKALITKTLSSPSPASFWFTILVIHFLFIAEVDINNCVYMGVSKSLLSYMRSGSPSPSFGRRQCLQLQWQLGSYQQPIRMYFPRALPNVCTVNIVFLCFWEVLPTMLEPPSGDTQWCLRGPAMSWI